jgi:hypothetical protein
LNDIEIIGRTPFEKFIHKWNQMSSLAENLLNRIMQSNFDEKLKNEAKKQFLIRIVTSFEVTMKSYYVSLIDDLKLDLDFKRIQTKKLRQKKYNILEIKKMIENQDPFGSIFSDLFNFQNLKDIDSAFRIILDFSIFDEFKDEFGSSFYPKLNKYFQYRHKIIHSEDQNYILSYNELTSLKSDIFVFLMKINNHILQKKINLKIIDDCE